MRARELPKQLLSHREQLRQIAAASRAGDVRRRRCPAQDEVHVKLAASTSMLREDLTYLTAGALSRGVLLAGGGALRPDIIYRLGGSLRTSMRVVPAPRTAALRGAAAFLRSAHAHPSADGT